MEKPSVNSVVYFIAGPGRIKAGYSSRPEQRLRALRHSDMEALTVIGTVAGTRRLEKHIHLLLTTFRLRGEWFRDCADVRCVVRRVLRGEICEPPAGVPKVAPDDLRNEIHGLVAKIAGPRFMFESRLDWLRRAAVAHGLSFRQMKSAFYGEFTDPLGKAVTRLRLVAESLSEEGECVRV